MAEEPPASAVLDGAPPSEDQNDEREKKQEKDTSKNVEDEPEVPSPHAILGPVYLCVLIDSLGEKKYSHEALRLTPVAV